MEKLSIAIDGPASAGKSTIARMIAAKLGYRYLDTGAMYRALTYAALQHHVSTSHEAALVALLKTLNISFVNDEGRQRVLINQQDVTKEIRSQTVSAQVSQVSAYQTIRELMVTRQQQLALGGGVVVDGRDIGTVVLPDAEVKIFLTATPEERARRRYVENQARGFSQQSLTELTEAIRKRDAEDAIKVDTTAQSIEEVVATIMEYVKKVAGTLKQ